MRARQQQQTTDSHDRLVSVFRRFGVSVFRVPAVLEGPAR